MIYNKRYSKLIRPALFALDLLMIAIASYLIVTTKAIDIFFFLFFWSILSLFFSFNKVYGFTKTISVVALISQQISVFALLVFAYYYILDSNIDFRRILVLFFSILLIFNLWRVVLRTLFRKYRIVNGGNYKRVIVLGRSSTTKRLESFFKDIPEYGYQYLGFFTDKTSSNKLGDLQDCFDYIRKNKVDEIYGSLKELSNSQMSELILFSDNNLKTLKFIPDNKDIFFKSLKFENYDLTPVVSLREIPLKNTLNKLIKRAFDIIFSLVVIVGVLSWFTPLLALLIRIESRGPVFFKQLRHGADFNLFACFKFRSMRANKESDQVQAAKNDMRVTNIGKFIRRTSIDELPQFFNVLFGNMSVVGPRPLLLSHTNDYKNKINKFMVRHTVKPGITGLAQVSGYRGNIETDLDMQNRVRYDIFYVENWSMLLDFKIILKTIINVIKGEEKAY